MGTGELRRPAPAGEPPRCGKTLNCVGSLCHERLGLNASRLFGGDGFADQLGQAT
ncbi:MAG: hypothetical protein ABSB68_05695 [Acidimicrobiales bacterium]